MKKKLSLLTLALLSMVGMVIAAAFEPTSATEEIVLTKANIEANDYLKVTTDNWAVGKTYGSYSGDFYNMSKAERQLSITVKGVSKFEVLVQNTNAGRSYTVTVGSGDAKTISHNAGGVESSGEIETGTTDEVTITLAGTDASVYPVAIKLTKADGSAGGDEPQQPGGEDVTATWDFHSSGGNYAEAGKANIQNTVGTLDATASDGSTISLTVDATIGKLYARGSDAQLNYGTIVKVPVKNAGDAVTVVSFPNYHNYTVGGTAAEADETTYEATATDASQGYVEIVATGGAYLYSISVTQKANAGEVEKPAVDPYADVSATWNFAGGNANAAAVAMAKSTEAGTIESEEKNGVMLTVEPNGLNIRDNGNSIQTGNGVMFKVPVKTTKDVVTVVGYSAPYFAYSVGGEDATEATTVYKAKGSDVSQGYVEVVNKGQYLISISVDQKSGYEEKPLYKTNFSDWEVMQAATSETSVEKQTRYTDETITFTLYNTAVVNTEDSKFAAYTQLPHMAWQAQKAADPYVTTSPLKSVTKVRFIHGATGSNRGWKLEAKGDGDEDWVVISNAPASPNSWCEVEKEINKTNCQLRWTNLTTNQNAYMFELDIYGMADMSKAPLLGSFKANGETIVAGDIFEMNDQGDYEAEIEVSKADNMISEANPLTDIVTDNGELGTISYEGSTSECTVTIPVSANGETVNYVAKFVQKPDFTLTYIDTDGTEMGQQTVEKDAAITNFDYDYSNAKADEGMAVRGWFAKQTGGKKYTTEDIVTADMTLYAVATEIEGPSDNKKYEFNLTNQYFYDEDHEAFDSEGTGKYYNNHGWIFSNGDKIQLLVGGKASISLALCQYSKADSKILVKDGSNTLIETLDGVVSTDGEVVTYSYEGEEGPIFLEIESTGSVYIHSIKIVNTTTTNYEQSGQWIFVKPNDASSFIAAIDGANSINAAADAERLYIYVPNGTYDLGTTCLTTLSGNNVSIIGQSRDGVIIKNKPEAEGIGVTATLVNTGKNNYFQDFTLKDEWPYYEIAGDGRGVCLQDKGSNTICKNVTLLSCQDTYYSNNNSMKAYWEDCDIHGTVDFICGGGDVMFKNTTLSLEPRKADGTGGRTITAPTTNTEFGYVFESCNIVDLAEGKGDWNYGRTWQNQPVCVYLNTTLDENAANTLVSSRWTQKGMNNTDPNVFGEFGTKDANGTEIAPASNIIASFGGNFETILSAEQAAKYNYDDMFGEWDPAAKTLQLDSPADATYADGTVSWGAVDDAVAYALFKNGELVEVITDGSTTYDITIDEANDKLTISAANPMGGFGEPVEVSVETAISELNANNGKALSTRYFNAQGIEVGSQYKGVVLKVQTTANGKKTTTKVMR